MEKHPVLVGTGMLELDMALGLLSLIAACIQYWRLAVWRATWPVYVGRWLVALGWTTLAARIFQTLWQHGDILISLPSLVSLILVSGGSIMITVFWRHGVEGPR